MSTERERSIASIPFHLLIVSAVCSHFSLNNVIAMKYLKIKDITANDLLHSANKYKTRFSIQFFSKVKLLKSSIVFIFRT